MDFDECLALAKQHYPADYTGAIAVGGYALNVEGGRSSRRDDKNICSGGTCSLIGPDYKPIDLPLGQVVEAMSLRVCRTSEEEVAYWFDTSPVVRDTNKEHVDVLESIRHMTAVSKAFPRAGSITIYGTGVCSSQCSFR